jgi:hypothetical protein
MPEIEGAAVTPLPRRRPFLVPGLFGATVSLIGVAPLPLGYYEFLRVTVIGAALALAIISVGARRRWWVAGALVAIVFWSPGAEVWFHPGKLGWGFLDLAVSAMFLVAAVTIPAIEQKPDEDGKLSPYGSWWFITLICIGAVFLGLLFTAGGNSGIPSSDD